MKPEIIEIEKQNAQKAYNMADATGKKLLENLFGVKVFSVKLSEKIKDFNDILEIAGKKIEDVIPYPVPGNDVEMALNGIAKNYLIASILNEGWVPDWNDKTQKKHYPWFEWNGSGFGFSATGYGFTTSNTSVGSRLCFRTSELAEFAGRTFISIYNEHLTIK